MADELSDRFALPMLQAAQAQKEVTHNEALALIDMLVHPQAESASLATPPASPQVGQCWIVASGGTDAWSGHDGELVCWTSGGWRFVAPRDGMRVLVADEGHELIHNGSNWNAAAVRADGYYVGGVKVLGSRESAIADPSGGSTVDIQARAVLAQLLAILRSHGLIETG